MSSGFFEFSVNLGDLLLAFVGVGGGAYAGSRAFQVQRQRADRRQSLYYKYLHLLRGFSYLNVDEFTELFTEARHRVRILPVPERELWWRYEDAAYGQLTDAASKPSWTEAEQQDALQSGAAQRELERLARYLILHLHPTPVASVKRAFWSAHLRASHMSRWILHRRRDWLRFGTSGKGPAPMFNWP